MVDSIVVAPRLCLSLWFSNGAVWSDLVRKALGVGNPPPPQKPAEFMNL